MRWPGLGCGRRHPHGRTARHAGGLARLHRPGAWLCKGFEAALAEGAPGLLAHEVHAQVAPGLRAGVLSGPSFAQEVALAQPTALVAASEHADVRDTLVRAFHSPSLRVYAQRRYRGCGSGRRRQERAGHCHRPVRRLQLGLNARAALITRGLAEITRLGLALGARAETFMGLSGLGDLVLTATGDLSRNRRVGLLLAQGQTLAQAVDSLGHVAEAFTARAPWCNVHANWAWKCPSAKPWWPCSTAACAPRRPWPPSWSASPRAKALCLKQDKKPPVSLRSFPLLWHR
jgi:glycerol-3-phosphate dehydrogenase